jgi:nitrite reductase/ring-hydroxylating ferredoxin subunit
VAPRSTPVDVCRVDDLIKDGIREFSVGSISVCIWMGVDGSLVAFHADCTHRHCPLVDGEVEDGVIMCPCHGAEFDCGSGAVLMGPATEPLPIYPVWIENDVVRLDPCAAL